MSTTSMRARRDVIIVRKLFTRRDAIDINVWETITACGSRGKERERGKSIKVTNTLHFPRVSRVLILTLYVVDFERFIIFSSLFLINCSDAGRTCERVPYVGIVLIPQARAFAYYRRARCKIIALKWLQLAVYKYDRKVLTSRRKGCVTCMCIRSSESA